MNESDQEEFLATFMSAVKARQAAGRPPVMRCHLEGQQCRAAHEAGFRQDLAAYERKLAAGAAYVHPTTTMAAPLTHGVAPPLEECTAITLAEAVAGTNQIWTGRVLFLRTTMPCLRVVATSFLVEDDAGDVINAHLYNYTPREEDPRRRFPSGTRLALLEPYVRHAKDDARTGMLMLRCDNPQAVVVFESEGEWVQARERARQRLRGLAVAPPAPAAQPALDMGRADELCAAGNEAFKSKAYDKALRLYSASLQHAPDHVRALANRCAVHMRCERWRAALADAEAALRCQPGHLKCRMRAAACLLALSRVGEAQSAAAQLAAGLAAASGEERDAALQREADELAADISRATAEQRGEYDLKAMRREADAAPGGRLSWRHAEFESAAVRVEDDAKKGRRLVALEPLAAGTLLMASKALAFVVCSGAEAVAIAVSASNSNFDTGSQSFILPAVVQTLLTRPETGEALYSLSGGAAFPPMSASSGQGGADPTRVDVPRIDAILSTNWFQAGGSEMKMHLEVLAWASKLGRNPTDAEHQAFHDARLPKGSGLWVRPSLLNHSCAPNCRTHQEGDFMFVMAARDIEAGEELCISYCDVTKPFAERAKILNSWNRGEGFQCDCVRCATCRQHPEIGQLEADIQAAYVSACARHVPGSPGLKEAVDAALPRAARRRARASFDALPLACQVPLCALLELEGAVLMAERKTAEGLAAFQRLEAIRAAANGGGSCGVSYTRLREKLRVVGAALMAGRADVATAEMRCVVTEACFGPYALLTIGHVRQFALNFAASVQAPPQVMAAVEELVPSVLRELLAKEQARQRGAV